MKRLISMLLILALCSLCAVAEVSFPASVTDQAGRSVIIEEQPERIISGYYITTSLLIALDLDEKLVGIENKAAQRPIYSLSAPELLELPGVGTMKEIDLELCASLEPDLVILPLRQKDAAQTLEALGIDVLLVNPESQELLNETIDLIAEATGTQARAEELKGFASQQEALLAGKLADADAPGVYLAGNSSMLSTAGDNMYQSDMIRLAGGKNVAAEIEDSYWVEISYEQLLAWNPEYIVIASSADYTADDVLSDPNLADCQAVQNGNVYQIPSAIEAWDSPVPSGILGAVSLASALHPEIITEADCNEVIQEYYEKFYGFTPA